MIAAACGGGEDRPKPFDVPGRPGRAVDVGGHFLYYECVGDGRPTVILEAGFGGDTGNWRDVQPSIARTTRTCSYDRAGLGGSPAPEGASGPRSAQTEIDDLERLLEHARIEGPYVLVGHSYGGGLARLFASQHARDVVGVVLVDSAHPDFDARVAAAVPELRAEFTSPRIAEGIDLRLAAEQIRTARSLAELPLVVLTAGDRDWISADLGVSESVARVVAGLWLDAQRELAALSKQSVHAVAERSDHFVQSHLTGQPGVVVAAVEAVVTAARARSRLPRCVDLFVRADVTCVSG